LQLAASDRIDVVGADSNLLISFLEGQRKMYEAVVWMKPWEKHGRQTFLAFKSIRGWYQRYKIETQQRWSRHKYSENQMWDFCHIITSACNQQFELL
jgi:hypothetical protein